MTPLVVDASVAVKWLTDEVDSDAAGALLDGRYELLVPAHFHSELANALVSKVRRRELTAEAAEIAAARIVTLPLDVQEIAPLVPAAVSFAMALNLSVYDALYLALAVQQGCQCVTADRRLYASARPGTVRLLVS